VQNYWALKPVVHILVTALVELLHNLMACAQLRSACPNKVNQVVSCCLKATKLLFRSSQDSVGLQYVRIKVLTAVESVLVFWVVTPCGLKAEDGNSKFIRYDDIYLHVHTASKLRRPIVPLSITRNELPRTNKIRILGAFSAGAHRSWAPVPLFMIICKHKKMLNWKFYKFVSRCIYKKHTNI
jgi:hypothetical protein